MITENMQIKDIILGFPQKAQRLRRAMRHFLPCSGELPDGELGVFLSGLGKRPEEIGFLVEKLNEVLLQTSDPTCISITEQAAYKLKEVFSSEGKDNWGIKLADRPADCGAGYQYVFEPSQKPALEDQVFFSHGVEIYAPRASLKRFLGSLIDYEEGPIDGDHFTGLLGIGFTISNPNVKTTCPCACSNMYSELE